MKKILLVNPWIHDFAAFDFWLKPLGLLRVAGALKEAGADVFLLDLLDRNHPWLERHSRTDEWGRGKFHAEEIDKPAAVNAVPRRFRRYGLPRKSLEEKLNELPDADAVLLTSGMTYWYTGLRETVEVLRKRYPGIPFIAGGVYATLLPAHAAGIPGLSRALPGSMAGFRSELERILGLRIPEKDSPPLWTLYPKLDFAVVRTSRGCPMQCTYCASNIMEPRFVGLDLGDVTCQFERLVTLGVRRAAFYDDALLFHPRFDELMERIEDFGFELHTPNGLHVSRITQERAARMRRAGFKSIYLSLETVDETLLARTGAKVSGESFRDAVGFLKDAGVENGELHAYVLVGLEGQSEDSVRRTLALALDAGVTPHITEFSPVPGTREFTECGLTDSADPLVTNNTAWTAISGRLETVERLKKLIPPKKPL